MVLTNEGMQIERSEEQSENADGLRIETFEPDSNVKLARLLQKLKQHLGIVSIFEETQNDWRERHP
jgi:hypothetical protein